MYHIKNDRRAVRSAEAIYEALVTLMAQKEFDKIKVSEIVEQAQIGRATFYRNFDTQEDVLRWRCDQIADKLIPYITSFTRSQPNTSRITYLKPILRFFYLDSTIIELLIEAGRIDILQVVVQEWLERSSLKAIALLDVPETYLNYWVALRSAAMVSILVQWVKEGKQHAPDDLADGLAKLISEKRRLLNLLL